MSALRDPGVYVGSHPIRNEVPYFKPTAIALRYPNGMLDVVELKGIETNSELFWGTTNGISIGSKPRLGDNYVWVRVGDIDDIDAAVVGADQAQYSFVGKATMWQTRIALLRRFSEGRSSAYRRLRMPF